MYHLRVKLDAVKISVPIGCGCKWGITCGCNRFKSGRELFYFVPMAHPHFYVCFIDSFKQRPTFVFNLNLCPAEMLPRILDHIGRPRTGDATTRKEKKSKTKTNFPSEAFSPFKRQC